MRAEWQQTLFGAENRAELASCVPAWPLEAIRIRVHRNHAFEPVASATRAYAAWNGLDFVFTMSGYDDSLSFDCNEADVDVVWFDSRRITTQPVEGRTAWLAGRLATLRAATTNPILVMAWPLVESELERPVCYESCARARLHWSRP